MYGRRLVLLLLRIRWVATRVYPIQYVGVCQRVAKQLNAEIFQTLTVKITQIPVA